jgi:phage protein D
MQTPFGRRGPGRNEVLMPPNIPVISGRPQISLSGARRHGMEADLLQMDVTERLGRPARCRLRLNNWGPDEHGRPAYRYFVPEGPAHGEDLEIHVHYRDSDVRIFAGRVTALGGSYSDNRSPVMDIVAEDPLESLRRTFRSRVFEDQVASDLVHAVAADHGLAAVTDLAGDPASPRVQLQQSDLDFLNEQVRIAGGDLWVRDATLMALSRGKSDVAAIDLELGAELASFRVLADLAHQVSSLRVQGWDQLQGEAAVGLAQGSAAGGVPGTDGAAVLVDTLGPGEWQGARSGVADQTAAGHLAHSYYRERTGRFITATGSGPGLPQLWASRRVTVRGLGDWFDGDYQLRGVLHHFDAEAGYRTDLAAERSAWRVRRLRRPTDDRHNRPDDVRIPGSSG